MKLCPFCGGVATISETEGGEYVIICSKCGACVNDDMHWHDKKFNAEQNVTEKWNKRTIESELLAAIRGMIGIISSAKYATPELRANAISTLASIHKAINKVEEE